MSTLYFIGMQEFIRSIILGIVQGLTEFIPVSSSGHLIIFEEVLGTAFSSLAYDVMLHFGTLLALLIYFRSDIVELAKGFFASGQSRKLPAYLVVATIPTAIAGFFLYDLVDAWMRSLWIIVFTLVALALLMFVADRRGGDRELEDMKLRDALLIGLAQVLSLVPGTSRAGSTIVAGSLLKFNNAVAAKFSFYMAIPITFGANLRVLFAEGVTDRIAADWPLYLSGALAAGITGYVVIALLLRYLSRHKLAVFAWYRIALAAILTLVLIV